MRCLPFLLLFVWSCDSKSLPKDVFTPEKMEAVLYDILRADDLVEFSSLKDSAYRQLSKRTALYDSVFQLHSINKDDYEKSMDFYESRPDLLKVILDSLHSRTDPARNTKIIVDSL